MTNIDALHSQRVFDVVASDMRVVRKSLLEKSRNVILCIGNKNNLWTPCNTHTACELELYMLLVPCLVLISGSINFYLLLG